MSSAIPIACDLGALDSGERERRRSLAGRLVACVEEVRELQNGYGLRLRNDAVALVEAAEFISLERRCCRFFEFHLDVEPGGGPIWLRLTGPEGVKEFLEANSELIKSRRS